MAVILMLLWVSLFGVAEASVHHYYAQRFAVKRNIFVVHGGSEGIYGSPHGSFIRFESITVRRLQVSSNFSSRVYAIVFETDDIETLGGSVYGNRKAVCCTRDLVKMGVCEERNIFYGQSTKNPGWPKVFVFSFEAGESEATFTSRSIQITKTAMYNLYFIHCDPNLKDAVVEGKTIWKNPTGYLPGNIAPLLKFYGYMSLAYMILSIFWFTRGVIFWEEVRPLQNCVALVISLGMLEMAFRYLDYVEFNQTGVRSFEITGWALNFGTLKRTVSRLIILLVSMGYGVVRPMFDGITSKNLIVGLIYFCISDLLEYIENLGALSHLSATYKWLLFLPAELLDSRYYMLQTLLSLSTTLNRLQGRRLMPKLDMFRKFAKALRIAAFVAVGGKCYELYFTSGDVSKKHWQIAWIIPAFWQVLSFSLLCVIAIHWAPSQNSKRYAYSRNEDLNRNNSLSILVPGQPTRVPSSGTRIPSDARPLQDSSNELSNRDAEEERTA